MCIAVPVKVTKVMGEEAMVNLKGVTRKINISLISKVEVGDYLLLHSGCAIKKVNRKEAERTLDLMESLVKEGSEEDV